MISRQLGVRKFHVMPELEDHDKFEKDGVSSFLSAEAYDVSWTQYQKFLLDELNKRTAGTQYENMSVFDILIATARHMDQAAVFNYSSLAHNNHFFFDGLIGPSSQEPSTTPLRKAENAINVSFTELAELKEHMRAIVESMSGNGFVWLVEGPKKLWYLVPTYNSGTPYDYARTQDTDLNGPLSTSRFNTAQTRQADLHRNALNGLGTPLPLLCIKVFEHGYLKDYGFDRTTYFENWWKTINWTKIEQRIDPEAFTGSSHVQL
ncbi:Manganese/iron superoxide dismutase [Lipomyces arxii]|uniref:mitochondrial 37S ribosomal protein mS42 n=1 Tax=Lipomyces arxii TaxID=56418 RepID=UPI0034CD90DA